MNPTLEEILKGFKKIEDSSPPDNSEIELINSVTGRACRILYKEINKQNYLNLNYTHYIKYPAPEEYFAQEFVIREKFFGGKNKS